MVTLQTVNYNIPGKRKNVIIGRVLIIGSIPSLAAVLMVRSPT